MSTTDVSPSELFILGYSGTELPRALRERFVRGDYAGLIFFTRNFADRSDLAGIAAQLAGLGAEYREKARGEQTELPPILSIDHEGGRVQRIKAPLTVWPAMARLAAHPPALAEAVGAAMGSELRALGFNLNYAPVLDVMTNPDNPIIGDRALGTQPAAAATRALALLRGMEARGVRGCGKHFPGHGDTQTDSHLTLPVVRRAAATLREVELLPFAEAARAGVGMLMTAHVVYPEVDAVPATLSRRWLTDILRGELGYAGVIVSDDMDMKALAAEQLKALFRGEILDEGEVVVQSLLAGCDAFLLCHDPGRQARAEAALVRAAATRPQVRARIAESVARLRRFRRTLAWPHPDSAALARMPDAAHQQLADALVAAPSV